MHIPDESLPCNRGEANRTSESKQCQRCGADADELRNLRHECLYNLHELGIPFAEETVQFPNRGETTVYKLHVCRACRHAWMLAIQSWWDEKTYERIKTHSLREKVNRYVS